MSTVRVLGVHLAAGVAWLAPISETGELVADATDRLEVGGGDLEPERALAELAESAEGLIKRLKPAAVALLAAGTGPNQPSAADSRRRGQLEAAIMISAHRAATPVVMVSHEKVGKEFGIRPSKKKEFAQTAEMRIGCDAPVRWSDRCPAFGAAIAALPAAGS